MSMSASPAIMIVTCMQTVPTLLALIIVHVRKDTSGMDARVQVGDFWHIVRQ